MKSETLVEGKQRSQELRGCSGLSRVSCEYEEVYSASGIVSAGHGSFCRPALMLRRKLYFEARWAS